MTIHVSKDVENSINAAVQSGLFPTVDEAVATAWLAFTRQQASPTVPSQEASVQPKPLWERIAELRKNVPAEDWDKLPTDGASQHDHYIYGTPKRPQR